MIQQISIKQAIINLSEDLDIPVSNQATLMKWAIEAEKGIHSWNSAIYTAELYTVLNSSVILPGNVIKVRKIVYGDHVDTFCQLFYKYNLNKQTTDEVTELTWSSLDGSQHWDNSLCVDNLLWNYKDGAINFPSNMPDQDVTIIHQVLNVDDEGFLIVNDTHIKAIRLYLELKYLKREGFKKSITGRYDNGFMNYSKELDMEYHRAVANARALDSQALPSIAIDNSEIFIDNDGDIFIDNNNKNIVN